MAPPFRRAVIFALAASPALLDTALAQQPQLQFQQREFSQQTAQATLNWHIQGRSNDLFLLLADIDPGPSVLFGRSFDLGLSPFAIPLVLGQLSAIGVHNGFLQFVPGALPNGIVVFAQFGAWDAGVGLSTLLVGNVDSAIVHAGSTALVADFAVGGLPMTGTFDRSALYRLQALPPSRRTVRPLPPQAVPFLLQSDLQSLHPSGARFQLAFRPEDLGGSRVPETLTAVRWRPLFGAVATETFPQFELRAAHTDVHPDYTIDPFTGLPASPNSGLNSSFAANPRAGAAPVSLSNGAYTVRPQDLLPSGYLPFPAPQQPFVYDGQSTLLLETLCAPTPLGGQPLNQQVLNLLVLPVPQPSAWLFAIAGRNGVPSPLNPNAATQGTGQPVLPDWELEFLRTTSIATTPWLLGNAVAPDYQAPILAASVPTGTSLALEFRGALDAFGTGATAWSSSQDVADGLNFVQIRVTMQADPVTAAVPWLDTLVVPIR